MSGGGVSGGGGGSPRSRLPKAALGLRDFLRRGAVLAQYRSFLREVRGVEDPSSRREMRAQIRSGYEANRLERSPANIKAALTEGARQLQFLRSYAGTARRGPSPPATAKGAGVGAGAGAGSGGQQGHGHSHGGVPCSGDHSHDGGDFGEKPKAEESWVGTGEPDDIRGRLGDGWPWGGGRGDR
jgi:hypothetical protein